VQRAPQDFTSWEAIYRTLAAAFPSDRYHQAVQRFGVLSNVANQAMLSEQQEIEASAPKLGVSIVIVEVRRPDELGSAFEKFSSEKCQAVIVPADGMFFGERRNLASLAAAARLPDIYAFRAHVEAGGMISYGVDQRANFRRAASYVDKIWKGTPAGELPRFAVRDLPLSVRRCGGRA
jgi:putative tryptophan/tyrosine transport system substrate-binding protein